jgi:hypothetical protein
VKPSKWDLILGAKPVPLVEHFLQQVVAVLGDDLLTWPPPLEGFDAASGQQFAGLFEEATKRPSLDVYRQAFGLTAWELQRNFEAIAEYFRNKRYLEWGVAESDKTMMLFVTRYLTEQLLALAEATEGRIKRTQLAALLDNMARYFVQHYSP